jgi:hypothetical protein
MNIKLIVLDLVLIKGTKNIASCRGVSHNQTLIVFVIG